MPWYWSDELAETLLAKNRIDESSAARLIAAPVAIRSEESSVEAAAEALEEDDEIPLSPGCTNANADGTGRSVAA